MTEEIINKIAIFQKKEIRRVIYKNEWCVGQGFFLLELID